MPRKGYKKNLGGDFTLNDSANAPKAVTRVKKSVVTEIITPELELSWDQLNDEEFDLVEEVQDDGTKNFVYKKKRHHSKNEDNFYDRPGVVYPEIVWYLISHYIKPEAVGSFAAINRATYAITKRESFWRTLYKRHCRFHPKLPERLRIENSYQVYGLRQRVIRGLYHTYDVFAHRVAQQATQDSRPHELVRRTCVNMWYCKGGAHWFVYFKFKKMTLLRGASCSAGANLIKELGRIDANPEEDTKVLQVSCLTCPELAPLMGLTLCSVSVTLSAGLRHRRLQLGFTLGAAAAPAAHRQPAYWLVLDSVLSLLVLDWWHPLYPHYDATLRRAPDVEDLEPVLPKDFFE